MLLENVFVRPQGAGSSRPCLSLPQQLVRVGAVASTVSGGGVSVELPPRYLSYDSHNISMPTTGSGRV